MNIFIIKNTFLFFKYRSFAGSYFAVFSVICLLMISHPPLYANATQQARTISGYVTDTEKEPIIGANVFIKGTTKGVVTNIDGYFILEVPEGAVIQISYVGFIPQEIRVGSQNSFRIVLTENAESLEEVVVVGYGTQRKVNLTGAIGTIKADEVLLSRPVTNIQELLASSVPGLNITNSTGAVGSAASINIRGTSTIGESSGVLVLIDGMPGNIYTLNPNDIESISVLKDASSAAIYGSRAANGVLLITTKSTATSDRPVVEFSTTIGIQNPQFKLDFVNASDYMKLYDQAMVNDGKDPMYGEQGQADLRAGLYPDNEWYKEVYRKNTVINNHYIALSGKEKSIRYRFSASSDNQQGTLPNNVYRRITLKPDLSFHVMENLIFRANMQYTQTNIQSPEGGTDIWSSQASRISPITPVRENGLYAVGSPMAGNPVAGVNEAGYSKERHKEMLAIFDVTYTPVKNWNIRAGFSSYTHDNTNTNRVSTYYLYDKEGSVAKTENLVSSLSKTNAYALRNQLQLLTDYSWKISYKHNFKLLGGYSQEYYKTENFWASRDNMPFDDIDVLDIGDSNKQNGGNAYDLAIQSWFGRFNYDYDGKYLLEASVRADGSSRFARGHRWGVFPSFSGGWNIHRESFLEDVSILSELKIRASWGVLGDSEKVSYYPTAEVLAYNPKIYSFNGSLVSGAYNNVAINKNISWEESRLANFGLDFGLLDQRIKLTLEYFINVRDNILYAPPVASEFGLNAPLSNLLKMKNQGLEVLLAYRDKKGDFFWGVDMNASYSKNKVLDMGGSDMWIEGNTITYLNDQYRLPYGYEAIGLFQSEDDIKNAPDQGNVLPGNIRFKDNHEDKLIDGSDRVVLNRKVPIHYGINLSFGYKHFDFSTNMYGRLNFKRYISGYEGWAFYLTQNARPMHMDSWSETNPNATYPRLTITNTANDTQYSSYWLRKADYLKIQNIQLGYTFPRKALDKVRLQYARVYVSGQNMATITGYDGFDPEGGWYPIPRTFAFGLNIQF